MDKFVTCQLLNTIFFSGREQPDASYRLATAFIDNRCLWPYLKYIASVRCMHWNDGMLV